MADKNFGRRLGLDLINVVARRLALDRQAETIRDVMALT